MTEHSATDGRPPPTEEDVLGQFLFGAVCDLAESEEWWPRLVNAEVDEWEGVVEHWTDWYAGSCSCHPLEVAS